MDAIVKGVFIPHRHGEQQGGGSDPEPLEASRSEARPPHPETLLSEAGAFLVLSPIYIYFAYLIFQHFQECTILKRKMLVVVLSGQQVLQSTTLRHSDAVIAGAIYKRPGQLKSRPARPPPRAPAARHSLGLVVLKLDVQAVLDADLHLDGRVQLGVRAQRVHHDVHLLDNVVEAAADSGPEEVPVGGRRAAKGPGFTHPPPPPRTPG